MSCKRNVIRENYFSYNKYCSHSINDTAIKYLNLNGIHHRNSPYLDCKSIIDGDDSNIEFFKTSFYINLTTTTAAAAHVRNIYAYDFGIYETLSLIDFKHFSSSTSKEFLVYFISRQSTTFRITSIPDDIKIILFVRHIVF